MKFIENTVQVCKYFLTIGKSQSSVQSTTNFVPTKSRYNIKILNTDYILYNFRSNHT